MWRALCGCPANASINCGRAPPSTATATPTRTTRRRLSLLVATACITRSFPPVRSSSSVRPPPSFVSVRFRVFPLFPYARDTIVRPIVIYLFFLQIVLSLPIRLSLVSLPSNVCACWGSSREFPRFFSPRHWDNNISVTR